jgi:amino acid adenylation domain-containing protein
VAVYSQRSASLIWALLGVLKAGAAFLILDSSYPAARLISCLLAAKPQGFLQIGTGSVIPSALEECMTPLSFRCRLQLPPRSSLTACDPLAEYSTDNPGLAVGPDDLAYITFTSGSTGTPKGVLGTHGPVSHFIQWHRETFKLDESDRFSMLSGLAHDPLLRDLFTPLCLGATLCIPDSEQMMMPIQLAEWMMQENISITHLTPAMGQILTRTTAQFTLPSLRYAFYGAEALTKRDVTNLQKLAPSATCVNFYGATETPQAVGYFIVSNQEDNAANDDLSHLKEMLPLGYGIKDVQLLILNACQRLAGVGEVGEIYVRSPYLAKGYIGNHELTRERFITNPFTRRAGDYLYRTGDMARYSPDGKVEFLGRIDQQVNVRGYRVELGEIEAVLSEHPAVRETVVIAREDETGEKRLVAYMVSQAAETTAVTELRSYLKERLPEYMIPSGFVLLDKLPLMANGKVDRRALSAYEQSRTELTGGYVAPQTAVEEIVANIWAEVLQVERVGIHDNFFDLGGHSLLATQVISRVRDAFRVELPLRVLFERPTVIHLATTITQSQKTQKDSLSNAISKADPERGHYLPKSVDQLSEADIDSLLSNILAGAEPE